MSCISGIWTILCPLESNTVYRIPDFWQFLEILLVKLSCLAQNYVQAAFCGKVISVAWVTKWNTFLKFNPWVLVCLWNAICIYVAKLEQQELLGCTLINGPVHFGQSRICRTSTLPDGPAMAVSLQNLIIFASCVKGFTTRKCFRFHDIKKKTPTESIRQLKK